MNRHTVVKPRRFALTIKHTRRWIEVCLWPSQKAMWAGLEKYEGYKTRSARACFVHGGTKNGNLRASMHFTKRFCGTEAITHESTHAALWLLQNCPRIYRPEDNGEAIAHYVGQIAAAVVHQAREEGWIE